MGQIKRRVNLFQPIKRSGLMALGRFYKHKGQYPIATIFYGKALDNVKPPSRPAPYYAYAYVLHENGDNKRALEAINDAINKSQKHNAAYIILRAEISIKLKQFAFAASDLHQLIDIDPHNKLAHYILGIIFILQKKWHQAEESLQTAHRLGYASAKFYHRLGQSSLAMEHFTDAAESYEKAADMWHEGVKSTLTSADLYYLAGLANERNGDTETSHSYYEKALASNQSYRGECLGIGSFHHAYHQYDLAMKAYADMHAAEPLYQLATIHDKRGETDQAITVYKKALAINQMPPNYHFRLGVCYESQGNYRDAAACFQEAIARKSNHDPNWYLELLHVLDKLGETAEYRRVFDDARIVSDYINTVYQNGDDKMPRHVRYNMFRDRLAVIPQTILFESMSGNRVSGNPLALFKSMLHDERFGGYMFMWAVNDEETVPDSYKHLSNVRCVIRYTDLYYKYLATASMLINNVTFPAFFIAKQGQKYLNTWHGTPWKTLGYDVKEARMDYANTARNFLHATHLLFPNRYTYDQQLTSYQIESIRPGKAAITGYPRIDLTYQALQHPQAMKETLGLHDTQKVIFYAPTWRGEKAFQSFDRKRLEADLARLGELDAHVLFRGHHLAEQLLADINVPNVTVVSPYLDTNEILSVVDILVTDYSSVFFDFLITDRPIVHYLYDYEAYTEERGLYFGPEALPGDVVYTSDDMIAAVQSHLDTPYTPTDAYNQAKATYVNHDDGNVAERVIDWFVWDKPAIDSEPANSTTKQNVLFHAGSFQPNGITSAFISVINGIDKQHYDITLTLTDAIINHPERLEQLERVAPYVHILPRTGQMYHGTEGTFAELAAPNGTPTPHTNQIETNAYRHEFKRLFADIAFDYIVDYSGYSPYYNQLLASNPNPDAKRIVFVHNDIYSEYTSRYPQLGTIFKQYHQYDKIVSVSKPTSDLNIYNLHEPFQIPLGKFDYVNNIQHPDAVRSQATHAFEPARDASLFSGDSTVFITIGRLSAEKDQEKLIRAFADVYKANPAIKLLIIGDGPLRYELQAIISELGLKSSVHLLGQKRNPYPYLKQADCFVLPSNYEGQPVVLYEALILGKPIIATDIIANRGILEGGYGTLCNNSIDGLRDAMRGFLTGTLTRKPFDIEAYNQRAIDMFHDKVLGTGGKYDDE